MNKPKSISSQYKASDIANYFLWKAQDGGQELLSNMKLQKLVYYAQGLHLVLYDTPLFTDKIEAWTYGPVVVNLYHDYKHYDYQGIPADLNFKVKLVNKDMQKFLDEIYDVFGQFSAVRLMQLTHDDKCWKDANPKKRITHKAMKECLKKYIKNG